MQRLLRRQTELRIPYDFNDERMREGSLGVAEEEEKEEELEGQDEEGEDDDADDKNGERMILESTNDTNSIDSHCSQEEEAYGTPQSSPMRQRPVDDQPFSASIGALYGEDNSFMHDLESIFRVSFWLCMHCIVPDGTRRITKFQAWNLEGHKESCKREGRSYIDRESFRQGETLAGLLVPLVTQLRKEAFPAGKVCEREDQRLYSREEINS
jgi:hypothetical protein